MDLTNRRVTVIGLSESGFSAAKLLRKKKARVRISELRDDDDVKSRLKALGDVQFETGAHTRRFMSESDLIVASPGVPPHAGPLQWAREEGIPVVSELELGYMFCAVPIVAVTGTNGKSTTATLVHEIFKGNGIASFLLGNIGRPICEDVLAASAGSVVALEVSSFQLEAIKSFRPRIAVLLNITQDHLDRYRDIEEYKSTKLRIFENQKSSDCAIIDYDDPGLRGPAERIRSRVFYFSVKEKVKGCYLDGDRLMMDLGTGAEELCLRGDIRLDGLHNLKNVLAAALSVRLIEEKADIAGPVRDFTGLKHRFEFVGRIEGIPFINDSKSTTVHSTVMALESFSAKSVILIAGGLDKASDYSPLRNQAEKLKSLILMGEASGKIRAAMSGSSVPIKEVPTMSEAVSFSCRAAKEDDTVLLSPMCASFDMFKDYKERGEAFRGAVLERRYAKSAGR